MPLAAPRSVPPPLPLVVVWGGREIGVLRLVVVVDEEDGGRGSEEGATPRGVLRSETGSLAPVLVLVVVLVVLAVVVDCACSKLHRLAASMEC